MKEVTNRYYPVGHIIISLNPNYNPNNQIQDTKWQLIEEGRFLQATTNSSRVGEKVIAGLPNITGEFGTGGCLKNVVWNQHKRCISECRPNCPKWGAIKWSQR